MTNSLSVLSRTTLGAHVSPALAHEPTVGSASTPFCWFQVTPLSEVETWMLIVWLGAAKFCVANP